MIYEQIQECVAFIRSKTKLRVEVGIILGTGLGSLVEEMEIECEIPYETIPHFPVSTVQSHQSKLVFGQLAGQAVVAMAGRFHYYEGYSMKEVTFPVRVMKFLGIQHLIVSNVSGSTSQHIFPGDLVFVKDHINLQPENPLRGTNDERLGPRFPDMMKVYDRALNEQALRFAEEEGIRAHEGVYVCLPGPNLETPAEYNFIHRIGGDLVGMSTVPEVIVARHMDIPVFAISVVSNQCYPPEVIKETTVESVIALANAAAPKMCKIVKKMLAEIPIT
ncbi:MAG: purine-nucleoside phosphorylase [Bacteroidota bacterium]